MAAPVFAPVAEGSSRIYTATLKDENGVAVSLASMVSLTLWLMNAATGAYINSRQAQNVLNTNNVTYHATSGLLTWSMQPADNPMVADDVTQETHLFEFYAVWNSGASALSWQRSIVVQALRGVDV